MASGYYRRSSERTPIGRGKKKQQVDPMVRKFWHAYRSCFYWCVTVVQMSVSDTHHRDARKNWADTRNRQQHKTMNGGSPAGNSQSYGLSLNVFRYSLRYSSFLFVCLYVVDVYRFYLCSLLRWWVMIFPVFFLLSFLSCYLYLFFLRGLVCGFRVFLDPLSERRPIARSLMRLLRGLYRYFFLLFVGHYW